MRWEGTKWRNRKKQEKQKKYRNFLSLFSFFFVYFVWDDLGHLLLLHWISYDNEGFFVFIIPRITIPRCKDNVYISHRKPFVVSYAENISVHTHILDHPASIRSQHTEQIKRKTIPPTILPSHCLYGDCLINICVISSPAQHQGPEKNIKM